jgi:hypothetical protein
LENLTMKINSKLAVLTPFVLAAAGFIGMAMSAGVNAAPVGGAKSGGKSCTVTSGKNAGKSGTYTTEEGNGAQWCEGSWGGTECTGGGKCKDAAIKLTIEPFTRPGVASFSFLR